MANMINASARVQIPASKAGRRTSRMDFLQGGPHGIRKHHRAPGFTINIDMDKPTLGGGGVLAFRKEAKFVLHGR